jgi:anti-sigma regulatory factor (Ser/Thr protein kinase)
VPEAVPTFTRRLTVAKEDVFATLGELQVFLEGRELSPRVCNAVEVAAEELLSNVWKYAFSPGKTGEAVLRVDAIPERVRLELADSGRPFDPTLVPPPPAATLDGAPGGRGIHLVRGLSSSFTFRREGDRNVVVVEFRAP